VDQFLDRYLRLAVVAAALGSLIMLALMLLNLFIATRWNWYNALAFFAATVCLAAARYLHSRVLPPAADS